MKICTLRLNGYNRKILINETCERIIFYTGYKNCEMRLGL